MDKIAIVAGKAVVKMTFRVPRRGTMIVLENNYIGLIPKNGQIVIDMSCFQYSGPEFVDGITSNIGIIASDTDVTSNIKAGIELRFLTDTSGMTQ